MVYSGLSVLDISKIALCDYWNDYAKPKYGDNAEIFYMDTNSFIVPVNLEDVYEDLAEDVKIRFHISNSKIKGLLPVSKSKKLIRLTKIYNCLKDDGCFGKKGKGIEVCDETETEIPRL